MPRLSRPKRRTDTINHPSDTFVHAKPPSRDVLELQLPKFLAMLTPYFDAWSTIRLQLPTAVSTAISTNPHEHSHRPRGTTSLAASVSLSQPTPQGTTPHHTEAASADPPNAAAAPPPTSTTTQPMPRLGLPSWLTRAIPSQLPAALWVVLAPPGQPDKRRLMTVHDFFRYTEEQGRAFFQELDRDGDERVTLDDLKAAMRHRNLPEQFAVEFLRAARGNRWWSNSIMWNDFKAVMDEKEPKILRAFTAMEVAPSGILELQRVKAALQEVGLPATDDNARAMLKAVGGDDGWISYSEFRTFCMLLPDEKLSQRNDPSVVWFESATMLPLGPPPEHEAGTFLLKAALAGGIASGTSTMLLHPLDSLKTRIQSTPGASIASVVHSVPGVSSLYRGIVPASTGTFVGHGVRTLMYEAALKLFMAVGMPELQAQGLASAVGTFVGTSIRIPCEVLKQRLQVGRQDNVVEAFRAAINGPDGARGLFRGTAATLSREVPFYTLGMTFYMHLKKMATSNGKQELAPWQTIALGAASGAMAAVLTTPGDVMKTRIMTAPADKVVNAGTIFINIVQQEGVGALFKGCIPRMVWTAPQGAMNFAGYELAKRALTTPPPVRETTASRI